MESWEFFARERNVMQLLRMENGCMWPRQVYHFPTHYVIINLHSHLFSKVLDS